MCRDQTTLHGDFHRGNLFYHKPTLDATGALGVEDIVAIDWAMFGRGHVAHELVYFLNTSVDRQRAADFTPEAALAEVRRISAFLLSRSVRMFAPDWLSNSVYNSYTRNIKSSEFGRLAPH